MPTQPAIQNNTIQLSVSECSPYVEGIWDGTASAGPGTLVYLYDTLDENDTGLEWYRPHGMASGAALSTFLTENVYSGGNIYTLYAPDDKVMIRHFRSGDRILAFVGDDAGTIDRGTPLVSAGDGSLRPAPSVAGIIAFNLFPVSGTGPPIVPILAHVIIA